MNLHYSAVIDGHTVSGTVTSEGQHLGDPVVHDMAQALIDEKIIVGMGPFTGPAAWAPLRIARGLLKAVLPDNAVIVAK